MVSSNAAHTKKKAISQSNEVNKDTIKEENLNFLLNKALPSENQAIKLKEAACGFTVKSQLENNLFIKNMKHLFELKAHKCPVSIFKGILI